VQELASPIIGPSPSGPRAVRRRAPTGLALLIVGPLLGLLLVGALSLTTINEVRVGGPQDDRMTQAHALVADTTTPSQNLTALRGTLLLLTGTTNETDVAALRAEVDQTELRYREGHAYWDTHLSDPVLRDSLLVEAHEPVATLFRLVHERLWPAIDRGDRAQADTIVRQQLVPLVDRHEQAMDRVSAQADDVLAATSDRTAEAIALRIRIFAAVLAAVMVLVAIALVAAVRLTRRGEDESVVTARPMETAPPITAIPAIETATPVEDVAPALVPVGAADAAGILAPRSAADELGVDQEDEREDQQDLAPTLEAALGSPLTTDLETELAAEVGTEVELTTRRPSRLATHNS
jgi:CHASE3 domain sensor protein